MLPNFFLLVNYDIITHLAAFLHDHCYKDAFAIDDDIYLVYVIRRIDMKISFFTSYDDPPLRFWQKKERCSLSVKYEDILVIYVKPSTLVLLCCTYEM